MNPKIRNPDFSDPNWKNIKKVDRIWVTAKFEVISGFLNIKKNEKFEVLGSHIRILQPICESRFF